MRINIGITYSILNSLMKTRQRAKIDELHIVNPIWHLTLALPKDAILTDLKLLARISNSQIKIDSACKDKSSNTKGKLNYIESIEEDKYNGRITRGKKHLTEIPLLPVKKRLKSEVDNLAVEGLYNLCQEFQNSLIVLLIN